MFGTGSWEEPDFADHATFSIRVDASGARILDALVVVEGSAMRFGRRLKRYEALAHPRIGQVWELVDFVVTEDLTVNSYVYGRHA